MRIRHTPARRARAGNINIRKAENDEVGRGGGQCQVYGSTCTHCMSSVAVYAVSNVCSGFVGRLCLLHKLWCGCIQVSGYWRIKVTPTLVCERPRHPSTLTPGDEQPPVPHPKAPIHPPLFTLYFLWRWGLNTYNTPMGSWHSPDTAWSDSIFMLCLTIRPWYCVWLLR